MWQLHSNQGQGFTPLAERANPEQLKAIAKDLRDKACEPEWLEFKIYDPNGHLRFVSAPSTSWRMKWKKPRVTEQLEVAA